MWAALLAALLALLSVQLVQVQALPDYCQIPACPGNSHTACKFPPGGGPAEKCSKAALYTLGDAERTLILSTHNQLRQKLADGKLDGFAGATDMQSLQWDDELATIAQTWADQCDYRHDDCRNVERWPVGQNIAQTGHSDGYYTEILKKVMMWWDEYKMYPYKDGTFKFNSATGHFTQMAWAKTNRLGCGRSSYVDGGFTHEYLVCNYGPAGNVIGEKIYTAGADSLNSIIVLQIVTVIFTLASNL